MRVDMPKHIPPGTAELSIELYDHLAGKETLIIYMAAVGEEMLTLPGGLATNGRCTRILRDSYDPHSNPKPPEIGTRLMVGHSFRTKNGQRVAREIPTDWVVSRVEVHETTEDDPVFRAVILAFCNQVPLSLEEFKEWVYDNEIKISLDSFGGDFEAYQQFLRRNEATEYSQV